MSTPKTKRDFLQKMTAERKSGNQENQGKIWGVMRDPAGLQHW